MRVLLSFLVGVVLWAAAALLHLPGAVLYAPVGFVAAGGLTVAALYRYFREQEAEMESAAARIRDYLAGNRSARIECEEEGEMYRLFHEINAMAATLHARAWNESEGKRFLKEMISDISHQLKTPLATLMVYSGILQEETDPAAVREFAALSGRELARMESLVQNLLKVAKFGAGAVEMERREEKIAEIMDDIERQFAYRAEQEGKTLLLSGGDDVCLWCDRSWMAEAIGNLVKNALDHTEPGDTVRIAWKRVASLIQITVSDTGSGIYPEDLPHIFKRFYRSRFCADPQGCGLGLALAKEVAEAHGGTIEAESELGAGTVFTVCIPTKM
ncbi:MAG: HAMP domain-containing sensor histidine kinase [Eubacteriales bacterium]|nr:HAMP domain-containing sensor histidine kinase [Eubacteriales bacterium]